MSSEQYTAGSRVRVYFVNSFAAVNTEMLSKHNASKLHISHTYTLVSVSVRAVGRRTGARVNAILLSERGGDAELSLVELLETRLRTRRSPLYNTT